ncbi:glycosyltransferase family 4 protein [Gemella cuniculi]|uniref:glycosyltransferase family 4 protein n=1 Tax=Gemella cuniculi TaxID=150240 RepID=UPI00040E9ED3|nr:glycosyltransferase family 4 protein [Gemella cuniculi]
MRVLHVLAQLPVKTGSGVYFTNVIDGLKNYELEQAAIYGTTPDYNFNIVDTVYEVEFEGHDIEFPIVGMSDVMPYNNTLYKEMTEDMMNSWQRAFREKLLKAKREFNPDVVITHHLWILSSIVCEIFEDKKIIAICHNTDIRQAEKNPDIKNKYVLNLKKLDKILALSSGQIDEIVEIFDYPKEHIINIGAGYNEKVFYPLEKYTRKEKIEILYAGKFDESKGFFELIKAFRKLEILRNDIELDLIGAIKDEDRERIFGLIGDSKNIKIYNALDQKHLGEIMRQKDIFILPSYFEGLGLIAVEALGSGLRVVATEIDGLIEFLGDRINNSDIIEYIAMPTIYDTDKAVEEEKPAFINRIVEALELMINRTKKEREIPHELMEEVERHSWKKKIETIYDLL